MIMSENSPDTPRSLDDEMDDERYEFPPELMPGADVEFDSIKTDRIVTVYQVGDVEDRHIKSDIYVYPLP